MTRNSSISLQKLGKFSWHLMSSSQWRKAFLKLIHILFLSKGGSDFLYIQIISHTGFVLDLHLQKLIKDTWKQTLKMLWFTNSSYDWLTYIPEDMQPTMWDRFIGGRIESVTLLALLPLQQLLPLAMLEQLSAPGDTGLCSSGWTCCTCDFPTASTSSCTHGCGVASSFGRCCAHSCCWNKNKKTI